MFIFTKAIFLSAIWLSIQGGGVFGAPPTPPPNYLTLTCTEAGKLALERSESGIFDAQVTSALYAYAPSHPHTNPTLLRELTPYIEYYCLHNPTLPLYAILTQIVVDLTYITLKSTCTTSQKYR